MDALQVVLSSDTRLLDEPKCRSLYPCDANGFSTSHRTTEKTKLTADGYSAYPLTCHEFAKKFKDDFKFAITQVIGLTNDDEVSKEFRPYKQMIKRLESHLQSFLPNYQWF